MTTDGQDLKKFLLRWRQGLRNRQPEDRKFWDGRKAYSDLKKTGYLERVRLEEKGDEDGAFGSGPDHFVPQHALPKICRILNAYKRDLNRVRDLVDHQKEVEEFLEQQARKIRKKSERLSGSDEDLAEELMNLAKKVDEVKRSTRIRLSDHFRDQHGPVLPYKKSRMRQERQLDTRFQVQLGVILRTFMQGDSFAKGKQSSLPKLSTIARLIVLFLVCADLADVKDSEVRLKHNQHLITVNGVLQQLMGAELR